jgi:hypothetical protein
MPAVNFRIAFYLTSGLAISVVVEGYILLQDLAPVIVGHGIAYAAINGTSDPTSGQNRPTFGMRMFSPDSPWNTPIDPSRVKYTPSSAKENRQFRDKSLANSWIQEENLLYITLPDDPVLTWRCTTYNEDQKFSHHTILKLHTPRNSKVTHGNDGWMIFTDPDGIHYYETWVAAPTTSTTPGSLPSYRAEYFVRGDLKNGTGWGKDGAGAGVRAAGASLLGGLILPEELDKLSIEHALPIELDWSQLKAGRRQPDQFVFPAVTADSDSVETYKGTIPMGARFALPPDLDLSSAGLTPEGLAVARAYQKYGGYVVDAAGHTASIAMITGGTKDQVNHLYQDADWIRQHLVMIVPANPGIQP